MIQVQQEQYESRSTLMQDNIIDINQSYDAYGDGKNAEISLLGNARIQFMRKVYSILLIQLVFTSLFVIFRLNFTSFETFQSNHPEIFTISFIVGFVVLIALCYSPNLSKTYPTNMILLGIFTLTESWMVSCICGYYEPRAVLDAALATTGATFGLTLFAWTTNYDFTKWAHFFYGFLWCFIMIIVWMTLMDVFIIKGSTFLSIFYATVFAILYSIYILIDTQLIMGGRSAQFSLDNYVLGAAFLYIDIISLFLKLLSIFGKRRN